MKRNLLIIAILFFSSFGVLQAQDGIIGSGFTNGWNYGSDVEGFSDIISGSYGKTDNANGTGNQYFRLVGAGTQHTITPGSDTEINTNTELSIDAASTTNGAMYINVTNVAHNYVFKTKTAGSPYNLIVFNVEGDVRTVTQVAKDITTVYPGNAVTITATLDGSLSTGQGVYLRYSDDGFTSSAVVEMTGSGTSYTAVIPGSVNVASAPINYYVFTSGSGLTISHANSDWYTINFNNNSGSNYSYSVENTYIWNNASPIANAGQWNNILNWNESSAIPGGTEVLYLDGDKGQFMTNDLPTTNRHRIFLGSGGAARSITGTVENTFYDYSGANPKIENNSSEAIGLSIDFPIKVGHTTMEINPTDGPIAFSKQIDNNGNDIAVWGDNGKTLGIGLGLIGTGGLSLNQNSIVSFFVTPVTYSGATTLNAGTLDLQTSAANTDITVKSGATLSINGDNITVKSITVESGGFLNILAGKSLTVSGNLANNSTINMYADGSGTASLIVTGSFSGSGTNNIQQYFTGSTGLDQPDGWHFVSSPVASQAVSSFHTAGSTSNDLYMWDEPTGYWINRSAEGGGVNLDFDSNFEVGKGYLISYNSNTQKTFTGAINNDASYSKTASYTAADPFGWNLFGNPYPSAIDWDEITKTVSDEVQVVQGSGPNAGEYLSWAGGTGGLTDGIIPPMQGFMTYATAGGQSITIEKADRVHTSTDFYKESRAALGTMKVSASGASGNSNLYIRFIEGATLDYDRSLDAHKLFGFSDGPKIFAYDEDIQYSINSLPSSLTTHIVDIAVKTSIAGEYILEFKDVNQISGMYQVKFEDKANGTWLDINEGTTYQFISEEGDNEDRFKLHFGVTGITEIQKEALQAYVSGQNLFILGEEGAAQLSVYDIQGKQLFKEQVSMNSQFRQTLDLPQGVYVVSVQSNELVKTAKVIIK